jgi:hypothetical protein
MGFFFFFFFSTIIGKDSRRRFDDDEEEQKDIQELTTLLNRGTDLKPYEKDRVQLLMKRTSSKNECLPKKDNVPTEASRSLGRNVVVARTYSAKVEFGELVSSSSY